MPLRKEWRHVYGVGNCLRRHPLSGADILGQRWCQGHRQRTEQALNLDECVLNDFELAGPSYSLSGLLRPGHVFRR